MSGVPGQARGHLIRTIAAAAALASFTVASPQELSTTTPGYQDLPPEQAIQNAPPGHVGRKTTDRKRRVGNTPATEGNHSEHKLVIGGFAKQCPTAEGIVEGNFEYSLSYDEVVTAGGERHEHHHARQLDAQLKARVGDDAKLKDAELQGQYTSVTNGVRTSTQIPARRFVPGQSGEPDWTAMRSVVEIAGDVAVASAVLMSGTILKEAEASWHKKENACVEFKFDPPTKTVMLAPEESKAVRVELRTIGQAGAPVARATLEASPLEGHGSLTPRNDGAAKDMPMTYTYKASRTPKTGHGFGIAALSRAGVAWDDKWQILDHGKYEGAFTYIDSLNAKTFIKVTGNLTWTLEDANPPSSPTFGDVESRFFRPSAGNFTIENEFLNPGIGGPAKCEGTGNRSFSMDQMAQGALRYMLLEIAADGRYKLTFVIPDRPNPFPTWQFEATCTFPNATTHERQEVRDVAVVLGRQEGRLNADGDVVGGLAAPIRRGPREITGNWSFKKPRQ